MKLYEIASTDSAKAFSEYLKNALAEKFGKVTIHEVDDRGQKRVRDVSSFLCDIDFSVAQQNAKAVAVENELKRTDTIPYQKLVDDLPHFEEIDIYVGESDNPLTQLASGNKELQKKLAKRMGTKFHVKFSVYWP